MATYRVTNQPELDDAISKASEPDEIIINSPAGVWLKVASSPCRVVARESSSVEAWESSSVEARGSSRVVARESSSVVARESSSVVAWESSRVVAWGSSSVVARESSSVVAGSHVAVHLHSARATVSGGVVIDITELDLHDPATWCEFHGVELIRNGEGDAGTEAVVYKAVRDDLRSQHGTAYPPGESVACTDWRDDNECSRGLHFSPSPSQANSYDGGATRFLEVRVKLADLRPITDGGASKCKAPVCDVVREVDLWREPVEAKAEVTA